ncbi:MAG: hypothetical protein KDA57_13900 [Planctomycetales bacterium]|nr:hypothetical protein [Planctomycetales bacterium]
MRARNSFGGRLSPTRYAGSTQQTPSLRLDLETPQDVAASLALVKNEADEALICILALPSWHVNAIPLLRHVRKHMEAECDARKWAGEVLYSQNMIALLNAAIDELSTRPACKACNTSGLQLTEADGWQTCGECGGYGYASWGLRRRWPILASYVHGDMTEWAYKMYWHEPLGWLVQHLYGRLSDAWLRIKRGGLTP